MEIAMYCGLFKKIVPAVLLFCFAVTGCNSRESALRNVFTAYTGRYAVVIIKKDFSLEIYDRNLKRVAGYRIGFGSNSDMKPKFYEGDDRTPEGSYVINEMLSMDAGKETESYRKLMKMNEIYFRASSGFHKFGKPSEDLGDNAYGSRYFGIDYPNEADRARYDSMVKEGRIPQAKGRTPGIGYGIAIHGNNDEESIGHLCSSGCIRLYNRDIVELEKYITISTPVLIFHD